MRILIVLALTITGCMPGQVDNNNNQTEMENQSNLYTNRSLLTVKVGEVVVIDSIVELNEFDSYAKLARQMGLKKGIKLQLQSIDEKEGIWLFLTVAEDGDQLGLTKGVCERVLVSSVQ